jgi:hypothetical protein
MNETKTAHTPGPWRPVFQPEGELVAHWDIFTPDGENLACLPETTQEPDARLIAAAPELLQVVMAYVILDEEHGEVYDLAWEAITKATGATKSP